MSRGMGYWDHRFVSEVISLVSVAVIILIMLLGCFVEVEEEELEE
jgi:hypothetical protein